MAISVTHATTATGADDPTKEINKGEWNAAHSLAGLGTGVETALGVNVGSAGAFVTFNGALGTPSSGTLTNATGLPEAGLTLADNVTNDVSTTKHGFVPKAPNVATQFLNGLGAWATPAGGAALSGITAATGANTIASGNNHSQIWNWALTADSVNAFTFGETTAATAGTSTSGVPNQYIARFATLAASTASAWGVYVRGAHVISASPSATQMLVANGSASVPVIGFASSTNSGFYMSAAGPAISSGGSAMLTANANNVCVYGSNGVASFTDLTHKDSGFDWPGAAQMRLGTVGVENAMWFRPDGAAQGVRFSNAGATTTSYLMRFHKSRGSTASPTVITTGDDLATISGYGYVGATNTYQEACRITFDSTGAISDSATGIGGIIRFLVATVGAEPAEAGNFTGDTLNITNQVSVGYNSLVEMTAPAGAANNARIFAQDNGAGKTQLMVIFGSGVAQQLAIEA